jgi:DNA polymerase IV
MFEMPSVERQLGARPPSSPILKNVSPTASQSRPQPDFTELPPIFVLPTHLTTDELHDVEEKLTDHGATLTYDIKEAKFILGKVGMKKRIELELRSRRLWTQEVPKAVLRYPEVHAGDKREPPRKRARRFSPAKSTEDYADVSGSPTESELSSQRAPSSGKPRLEENKGKAAAAIVIDDSTTESEGEATGKRSSVSMRRPSTPPLPMSPTRIDSGLAGIVIESSSKIRVVKLAWLADSITKGAILPIGDYLVYEGTPIVRPATESTPQLSPKTFKSPPKPAVSVPAQPRAASSILERAKVDVSARSALAGPSSFLPAPHGERRFKDQGRGHKTLSLPKTHQPDKQLLAQTTSEFDGTDSDIPSPPDWVIRGLKYACQRVTPANPPNENFTNELEKIKLARLLTNDEIGVRAYSTSIAALRAYPYKIISSREILRLPGCDVKIANLWIEWKNTGSIKAASDAESDESLQILRDFYNIWGVGAHTAREFYYDKGWRDRDDIVEYGWNTLNRVQQIGLKYYDEFQQGIPRAEVEFIAVKVKEHAIRVRDEGIELMVVGGYRRGKEESGDVDMIVSHRNLGATANLVTDVVASLEQEEWITHTLLLALTTTERKQATLPFKSVGVASHGAGFDTLDKALVVWQDPSWPTKEADLAADPKAKNPAPHRRVDIIVSPWRTVGTAVYGWSGGTTFQRDTRRYAKYVKGWKFDSSGIRDRSTGEVVRLEGEEGVSGSMEDAEKVVFRGLGLEYRKPWERCTG